MALSVEDGTGLSAAESFISVADIQTYFTAYGIEPDGWCLLSDADQEAAARRATQYIESQYRTFWKGVKKTSTQALGWPRSSVYDEDGYLVNSSSVPTRVANATAEVVRRLVELGFSTTELIPDKASGSEGSILKEKKKAGPVEKEITYASPKSESLTTTTGGTAYRFPAVDKMLAPLLSSTPGSSFGMQFKRGT